MTSSVTRRWTLWRALTGSSACGARPCVITRSSPPPAAVGQAGTWLADTQPLMVDALARLSPGKAVTAHDLGAGIGRHTLPMLGLLRPGPRFTRSTSWSPNLIGSAAPTHVRTA
jgi:hypothetical protein